IPASAGCRHTTSRAADERGAVCGDDSMANETRSCPLMPVIEVDHLQKRYGDTVAVSDVSFSIEEGEIFGILGPNGAGKTTTVECIAGLRTPDSGSISVYGLSPRKDRNKLREFVGVQLQGSAL